MHYIASDKELIVSAAVRYLRRTFKIVEAPLYLALILIPKLDKMRERGQGERKFSLKEI